MSDNKLELQLPAAVTGQAHLARMVRELEAVENDLEAQKARDNGNDPQPAALSRSLGECVELNKVDINDGHARKQFKKAMNAMKSKAPVMHFTFAAEPDAEFLQKLAAWIRQEIHPQALISVGLQPSLVAGAYLRTPNHVHDFSLKAQLHDKRSIMVNELEALHTHPIQIPQVPAPQPAESVHEG